MIEKKNSIFLVLILVILATFLMSTFSAGATPADKKKLWLLSINIKLRLSP